jgi:2-polyprenyl-3-methyl-5-hydroxy-6-metoxy-1,4-benzoquinol methylase
MSTVFRDPRMDQELNLDGLHPRASEWVFNDLTAYLNKPIEAIAEDYWIYRDSEDIAKQVAVGRATNAETVNAYYAQTPHYLYELSYWEASSDKQAWFDVLRHACQAQGFRTILDFGGGVGGLSLNLGRSGFSCTHLDIPGKTSGYAAWRFQRHGVAVEMIDALGGWPDKRYDAVVAWDVLEHLFDLEPAIAAIAQHLTPRGWFITKSTFADEDGHHEEIHLIKHAHYHDMQRFNAMICSNGLSFLGQLKPDRLSRLLCQLGFAHAVAGYRITPKLKHGDNFLVHQRTAR